MGESSRTTLPSKGETTARSGAVSGAAGFVSLVTAIRWATTTVGLVWAVVLRSPPEVLGIGALLLVYSLFRTFTPLDYGRVGWRSLISILLELAICLAAVVTSGCWDSPFIFSLFTPVIAAGFARGFWHSFRIAITSAVTVGLAARFSQLDTGVRPVFAWTGELLLTAGVASYARYLVLGAKKAEALNLSQLWRLNEANALLMSLNHLSHDLPVSFDFQETAEGAVARVREAVQPDLVSLLLWEPQNFSWRVAIAEGDRLRERYLDGSMPAAARRAAEEHGVQAARDLSPENPGFSPRSRSALYAPLWAGPRHVGMLVMESEDRNRFGPLEMELIEELAEPMALTIDNARWFERLRARGATQERNRIARDLHDRIGQGIAYVAFELDRLSGHAKGTPLEEELHQLRDDARFMVRELRETLYDLRTDVSDEHGVADTIRQFLGRVFNRSGIQTDFDSDTSRRLPLHQEREVWRIAQEAIVNAERHANAQRIQVTWTLDERRGVLTVRDDGKGLSGDRPGAVGPYVDNAPPVRPSYGVTGMRERADGLRATLTFNHLSPSGTEVELVVPIGPSSEYESQPPGLEGEHAQ